MLFPLVFFLPVFWASATHASGSDLPLVLPPISSTGAEVVVLIVPGAYINALMYQPLGEALQNATSLKLWVGLVGPFVTDLPNPEQCSEDIETTLAMMRDMWMNSSVLFLAGHSLGGVVMQTWGWDHEEEVTGFILMASELMKDSLSEATRPVMHISGDLDGLETVAEIAPVYKDLQSLVTLDVGYKVSYPVVILQDVNHMHFASGDPPIAVSTYDILSPLSEEDAHNLLAFQMMAYVTAVTGLPTEGVQNSKDILLQDYDQTFYMLQPLFENYYLTDGATFSEWSQIGQVIMSSVSVEDRSSIVVNDSILSMDDLVQSRPTIEQDGMVTYVNTYTHISYPIIVNEDVSASEMAVKFKSSEALREVMEPLGASFGGNTSCQLINEVGFSVALSSATALQKERYESRSKKVFFLEDDLKATGDGWVQTSILYNQTDTNLFVTSAGLHTSVDAGFGLGGMYYCKLMPPARMIEYIMVESLRGTQP